MCFSHPKKLYAKYVDQTSTIIVYLLYPLILSSMIVIGCTTHKMTLNLLTPKCFHLEIAHILPRSNIIVMYFLWTLYF